MPQLRPRVNFVAIRKGLEHGFSWPAVSKTKAPTVGEALYTLMASNGWKGAKSWKARASEIAPTLVGGSKKHGGPDLGPTRAKRAWAALGIDGMGIADDAPKRDFAAYRQVGNAFPPPVAYAVAAEVRRCLEGKMRLEVAS